MKKLDDGGLWPEPLIQFNPSFEEAGTIESLITSEKLPSALKDIFYFESKDGVRSPYTLYKHQIEAIRKGVSGEDFIVTSGTGSGKSLTYIGTIFSKLLKDAMPNGVKAVIVYPMNALINSQLEELERYKQNFESATGKEFPITFGRYTGQESQEDKDRLRNDQPDILLTNYMMLELLLTRCKEDERTLRNNLFENIKYLVFDELHTYRGRQGSDVGLLIRRIRAHALNDVTCIGTSATMASKGTILEQKKAVANAASLLFGKEFEASQVIGESLRYSLSSDAADPNANTLKETIKKGLPDAFSEEDLIKYPTAIWLERKIATKIDQDTLLRNKPVDIFAISKMLSKDSCDTSEEMCKEHLTELLLKINDLNEKHRASGSRYTYLPFKLHQFFAQSGTVYSSLDLGEDRYVSLDPDLYVPGEGQKPAYPTVFSRQSGRSFHCVTLTDGQLVSREFRQTTSDEDQEKHGYLITDIDIWDPVEDLENLPSSWVRVKKDGSVSPVKKYAERIPQKVYYNTMGQYSNKPTTECNLEAWFMPAPLLFDPSSGAFFNHMTKESTKLNSLGTEGRSTSTTITSFSTLRGMGGLGLKDKDQKLLSFSDNRQDAALQAGHFNDFINVIQLRTGIYNAIKGAEGNKLDFSNIGASVLKALNLPFSIFSNAEEAPKLPHLKKSYEDALKLYLVYRLLHDLRRGWRVILPNLEQCALLKIKYLHVEGHCWF
jgi:hypothetical protein